MIRPARPGDAAAVRTIVRAAYRQWAGRFGRDPSPMHDDYAKHIADGEAWVLEHLGEAIGVVILKDSPGALLIPNIAVIPAAQGQGHGRRLLTFAEQEARQRGVPEVRLFVNALMVENIALYQHLGFREIERIGERGDRAYVQLAKRVTQHK